MDNFGLLLYNIVVALFAFFGAAPCILNAISLFGVQKRFTQTMVDEGIISAEEVRKIQPKKQIASTIIAALILGILLWFCYEVQSWGFVSAIMPLMLGFWKFRKILQLNNLTVKRFLSTYQGRLDTKKFNKYVKKHS